MFISDFKSFSEGYQMIVYAHDAPYFNNDFKEFCFFKKNPSRVREIVCMNAYNWSKINSLKLNSLKCKVLFFKRNSVMVSLHHNSYNRQYKCYNLCSIRFGEIFRKKFTLIHIVETI